MALNEYKQHAKLFFTTRDNVQKKDASLRQSCRKLGTWVPGSYDLGKIVQCFEDITTRITELVG